MEAVGDLDDDDAHVFGHRDEHLAQCLGVGGGSRGNVDVLDLRRALDETRNVRVEALAQLVERDAAVLDDIVEERGDDRVRVHVEARDERGDGYGMRDVWLTGAAQLASMACIGKLVRALDRLYALFGEVRVQRLEEVSDARGSIGRDDHLNAIVARDSYKCW